MNRLFLHALTLLPILGVVFSFWIVASFVVRENHAGRLLGNRHAPAPFLLPPALGWSLALGPVFLVLAQSYLFYLTAPLIIIAAGGRTFGWARLPAGILLRDALLICGAFVFVLAPLTQLTKADFDFLHWPEPEQEAVAIFRQLRRPSEILFFLLQAVVLAPFMEELFFRGFLFPFLKKDLATGLAILLSSAVFAFVHLNLASFFPLWVFGAVLALAYEYTGSLLLCMTVHGLFNLGTALALLGDKP